MPNIIELEEVAPAEAAEMINAIDWALCDGAGSVKVTADGDVVISLLIGAADDYAQRRIDVAADIQRVYDGSRK